MTPSLLLPGWGLAPAAVPDFGQDRTLEYGFFGAAPAFPFADPLPALRAVVPAGSVLVGHSLGALLALWAAVALPPGTVRALILFAPFARFTATADGWPGQPDAAVATMCRRVAENPAAVLRSFLCQAVAPERWPLALPATFASATLAAGLACLRTTDLREEVANLAVPALILHGEEDRIVPVAQADRLAALLPRVQVRRIAGAGHLLPITRADDCRRAIAEFLDDPP